MVNILCHFWPISGTFYKIRVLNFCGKIITFLASSFTLENTLFKLFSGQKMLICQPNSKIFAAPAAKHFVLNTDMKFVISQNNEYFFFFFFFFFFF